MAGEEKLGSVTRSMFDGGSSTGFGAASEKSAGATGRALQNMKGITAEYQKQSALAEKIYSYMAGGKRGGAGPTTTFGNSKNSMSGALSSVSTPTTTARGMVVTPGSTASAVPMVAGSGGATTSNGMPVPSFSNGSGSAGTLGGLGGGGGGGIVGGIMTGMGLLSAMMPSAQSGLDRQQALFQAGLATGSIGPGAYNAAGKLGLATFGNYMTSVNSDVRSMALLANYGYSPASRSGQNMLGQIGAMSLTTGMSNETIAGTIASQSTNPVMSNRLMMLGINQVSGGAGGGPQSVAQLANQLVKAVYNNPTPEKIRVGLQPGGALDLMIQSYIPDSTMQMLVRDAMFKMAMNGGKAIRNDASTMTSLGIADSTNNPRTAAMRYTSTETRLSERFRAPNVQGATGAMDSATNLTEAFIALSDVLGPVIDGFAVMQSYLGTFSGTRAGQVATAGVTAAAGILGAATGGYVSGPGSSTSDSVPARLSNGEYVMRASAVQAYGKDFFDSLNAKGYARGGLVEGTSGTSFDVTSMGLRNIRTPSILDYLQNKDNFNGAPIMSPKLLRNLRGTSGSVPIGSGSTTPLGTSSYKGGSGGIEFAKFLYQKGLTGTQLETMWALGMRESGGQNVVSASGRDFGIFQINDIHRDLVASHGWTMEEIGKDPEKNFAIMMDISNNATNFFPWAIDSKTGGFDWREYSTSEFYAPGSVGRSDAEANYLKYRSQIKDAFGKAGIPNYSKGAWKLSSDETARVHTGEMILPSAIAEQVRTGIRESFAGQSGSGKNVSIYVTVADGGEAEAMKLARRVKDILDKDEMLTSISGIGA